MRDSSFQLAPTLTPPEPPFSSAPLLRHPWTWQAFDALGREVASARTRAGIRAALVALYGRTAAAGEEAA